MAISHISKKRYFNLPKREFGEIREGIQNLIILNIQSFGREM